MSSSGMGSHLRNQKRSAVPSSRRQDFRDDCERARTLSMLDEQFPESSQARAFCVKTKRASESTQAPVDVEDILPNHPTVI